MNPDKLDFTLRQGCDMTLVDQYPLNLGVADLFRQFVTQIGVQPQGDQSQESDDEGEVMCAVEINGIRYSLLRERCLGEEDNDQICLSPREKEIVRLVMKGMTTRGIATLLDISPWTVSTHLRRVFSKLGVSSRAEMVACVLKKIELRNSI